MELVISYVNGITSALVLSPVGMYRVIATGNEIDVINKLGALGYDISQYFHSMPIGSKDKFYYILTRG